MPTVIHGLSGSVCVISAAVAPLSAYLLRYLFVDAPQHHKSLILVIRRYVNYWPQPLIVGFSPVRATILYL